MKQQRIVLCLSLLVLSFAIFSACSAEPTDSLFPSQNQNADNTDQTEDSDYEAAIRELENRIIELQQNQYISDAEYEKELSELLTRLEALKAEQQDKEPDSEDSSTPPNNENESSPTKALFLYKVADGEAIITKYTGSDANVVIPTAIDGYKVCAIGEGALASEQIQHVIIGNGVRRIEWFAFRDCPNLSSVTIPDSVTSIGYEAFGARDKSFTIYCHSGSFAQSYAKSYGITYAIH